VSKVLYPGSFDPFHNGHLEVVATAAELFGRVVVAVMRNAQKASPLFDDDERVAMIERSVIELPCEVVPFTGLVVDVARDLDVDFIVKGLRVASDFEVELQMAQMNEAVAGVRTVYLPTRPASAFLSSRFIRDIARFGGDVNALVPPPVAEQLVTRFHR
jgi:pantetheine-phosphate adenylyltransferase